MMIYWTLTGFLYKGCRPGLVQTRLLSPRGRTLDYQAGPPPVKLMPPSDLPTTGTVQILLNLSKRLETGGKPLTRDGVLLRVRLNMDGVITLGEMRA